MFYPKLWNSSINFWLILVVHHKPNNFWDGKEIVKNVLWKQNISFWAFFGLVMYKRLQLDNCGCHIHEQFSFSPTINRFRLYLLSIVFSQIHILLCRYAIGSCGLVCVTWCFFNWPFLLENSVRSSRNLLEACFDSIYVTKCQCKFKVTSVYV